MIEPKDFLCRACGHRHVPEGTCVHPEADQKRRSAFAELRKIDDEMDRLDEQTQQEARIVRRRSYSAWEPLPEEAPHD